MSVLTTRASNQTISAGDGHSLVLDPQGQVWSFGHNDLGQLGLGYRQNRDRPEVIPNLTFIMAISAGGNHSLVLDQQGQVWAFGGNRFGQLGLSDRRIRGQ